MRRLAPGLQDVVPLLVAAAVLTSGQRLLGDADTGWHVRTGELILQTGSVPRADPYSFTAPGRPWFAFEWLCDVGMAALHGLGGLEALVAASAVVLGLSFWMIQRLGLALGGRPLATLCIVLLGAAATTVHWLARPHLLSYPLMAAFVAVLESGRPGLPRWPLLALPGLSLLWCNLHGAFPAGWLVLLAYLAGGLLPGAPRRWSPRDLAATLLLCVLATAANPYGLELHRHLLSFVRKPVILQNIEEYLAPDFQSGAGRLLELWLLGAALALGPLLRARDWPRILLLLGLAHMTLTSHRHVELLILGSAPLLAAAAGTLPAPAEPRSVLDRLRLRLRRLEAFEAGKTGPWGLPAAALLALSLAAAPGAWQWAEPFGFPGRKYPVEAAQRLAAAGARRVLSTDSFGGYLIYCCWPGVRVFMDGRSDFYSTTPVFDDHLAMLRLRPGWVERVLAYGPDSVLLPRRSPALRWLLLEGGWAPVHDDATAALLLPRPSGGLSPEEAQRRDALLAGTETGTGR